MFIYTKWIAAVVSSALICAAHAQDYAGRKELKRSDLTGTNMEVVVSISETKPGETLPRHIHHGEETFYLRARPSNYLTANKCLSRPEMLASPSVI